jgi:hypothetical protein
VVPAVGECFLEFQGEACPVPPIPDPNVPREKLQETQGPADAQFLPRGDYWGELGQPLNGFIPDAHDWYMIETTRGEAVVFWTAADPGLDYIIYLQDECGEVIYEFRGGEALLQCIAPCTEKDVCRWYIRVVHRGGQGKYYLSIYSAKLAPE